MNEGSTDELEPGGAGAKASRRLAHRSEILVDLGLSKREQLAVDLREIRGVETVRDAVTSPFQAGDISADSAETLAVESTTGLSGPELEPSEVDFVRRPVAQLDIECSLSYVEGRCLPRKRPRGVLELLAKCPPGCG